MKAFAENFIIGGVPVLLIFISVVIDGSTQVQIAGYGANHFMVMVDKAWHFVGKIPEELKVAEGRISDSIILNS